MKNTVLRQTAPLLARYWDSATAEAVVSRAEERLVQLCRENASDSKALRRHREGDIFPCISLYESLQQQGVPKERALTVLDEIWRLRAEKAVQSTKMLMKIPGLYRLYPSIFRWVACHQYGTAAGFKAVFYDTESSRCKFDMVRCLYCDTCSRYGCRELVPVFCHVDDVNNTGLHPRLCWNRTKFMGGGGNCCDFDIFVTREKP